MRAEAEPLDRERAEPEVALGLEEIGAPVDVDALAVRQVEAQRVEAPAPMVTPRQAPSAGSLSVKKTVCQRSWRRSSVTSPSTHTVGRRASHSAMPRLKAATE